MRMSHVQGKRHALAMLAPNVLAIATPVKVFKANLPGVFLTSAVEQHHLLDSDSYPRIYRRKLSFFVLVPRPQKRVLHTVNLGKEEPASDKKLPNPMDK